MNISLPSLPYAVDALEPHLSRRTLSVHHGNHHAAYVAKTRALISTPPDTTELEDVVRSSAQKNQALFNASAQAWNHAFFWRSMRPGGGGEACGSIAQLIESSFGSQRAFSQQFVSAAGDQFGSGWAWLVLENDKLQIVATSNAGTPLTTTQRPLLTIDVWEHAYYLDYQHRRLDYIAAFLGHLVSWILPTRTSSGTAARARRAWQVGRPPFLRLREDEAKWSALWSKVTVVVLRRRAKVSGAAASFASACRLSRRPSYCRWYSSRRTHHSTARRRRACWSVGRRCRRSVGAGLYQRVLTGVHPSGAAERADDPPTGCHEANFFHWIS